MGAWFLLLKNSSVLLHGSRPALESQDPVPRSCPGLPLRRVRISAWGDSQKKNTTSWSPVGGGSFLFLCTSTLVTFWPICSKWWRWWTTGQAGQESACDCPQFSFSSLSGYSEGKDSAVSTAFHPLTLPILDMNTYEAPENARFRFVWQKVEDEIFLRLNSYPLTNYHKSVSPVKSNPHPNAWRWKSPAVSLLCSFPVGASLQLHRVPENPKWGHKIRVFHPTE